jgi:hypothetical protein
MNMPGKNPIEKPPNIGQTKLRTRHPVHFPIPTFDTFPLYLNSDIAV